MQFPTYNQASNFFSFFVLCTYILGLLVLWLFNTSMLAQSGFDWFKIVNGLTFVAFVLSILFHLLLLAYTLLRGIQQLFAHKKSTFDMRKRIWKVIQAVVLIVVLYYVSRWLH